MKFIYAILSAENKVIPAHGKALVDIQISIAVPEGTYGRVAPRSGLGMCLGHLVKPKVTWIKRNS